MWKVIFHNLWSRRKKIGWIFTELAIVTMILWVLIDVSTVFLYNKSLPNGYDNDRLCQVDIRTYSEDDPMYYNEEYGTEEACNENIERILRKVKDYEGVENATYIFTFWQYLGTSSVQTYYMKSGNEAVDSLIKPIHVMRFHPNTNYFETYGIETTEGSPSPEELSELNFAWNDAVITEDVAKRFFGKENAVGKKLFFIDWKKDTIWCPIKAVVKDVRHQSYRPNSALIFRPLLKPEVYNYCTLVVRVKDGVDMSDFLKGFDEFVNKELNVGNFYAEKVESLNEIIRVSEISYVTLNDITLILTVFFLINLSLGVVGTFWLQTRDRVEEMGVLRTFGATKWNIRIMLLGEGFVLSTLAVFVGCMLYLQIALHTELVGTSLGMSYNIGTNLTDSWILHFGEHFMIVSLLCYVVITITMLIGIYIPARSISNVNPIEALRVDS